MNNIIVYCELEEGKIADVSFELLTKGRSLANQLKCKLEALLIGHNLKGYEKEIFPYGVDTLYVADDQRLAPYSTLPFDHFHYKAAVIHIFFHFQVYHSAGIMRVYYFFFHHPFTHGSHLRTAIGIDNGGNDITPKCRTNLV